MKSRKRLSISLITVIALIILANIGYYGFISNFNCYKIISDDTKYKITSIVKEHIGEIPNLQIDNEKVNWCKEMQNEQQEMMDKILNNLTIVGESTKGKPGQYILEGFYKDMNIYIPYNKKNPHNNIIIYIDSIYYIANSNKEEVKTVLDYMKVKQCLNNEEEWN